jgi:hypothetical protein
VCSSDLILRFRNQATTLIFTAFPEYKPYLKLAPTSFRPLEVSDRVTSWRADDKRLHVDAFPSRPNYGERILRVFINVNPEGAPRVWRIGEPFSNIVSQYLEKIKPYSYNYAKLIKFLGVTKSLRSEYDHIMLGLHDAMKSIIPDATFIGFTGTPLLKMDKKTSIEVFGPYIHTYKFDEAVKDGVVLDLLYEARDVDQHVLDQKGIDEWFEGVTRGMNDIPKAELKKRWGTMQKVLSSKSRLEKIVFDIIKDFKIKPRLKDGKGNAILVSRSIYEACRYYELFQYFGFKKCAIIA